MLSKIIELIGVRKEDYVVDDEKPWKGSEVSAEEIHALFEACRRDAMAARTAENLDEDATNDTEYPGSLGVLRTKNRKALHGREEAEILRVTEWVEQVRILAPKYNLELTQPDQDPGRIGVLRISDGSALHGREDVEIIRVIEWVERIRKDAPRYNLKFILPPEVVRTWCRLSS